MTRSLLTLSFALLTSCTPTVELDPVRVNAAHKRHERLILGLYDAHQKLERRVSALDGTPYPTPIATPKAEVIGNGGAT